jgi:hypothetical protein
MIVVHGFAPVSTPGTIHPGDALTGTRWNYVGR